MKKGSRHRVDMNVNSLVRYLLDPNVFFWMGVLLIRVSGKYRRILRNAWDPSGFLLGTAAGVCTYYGTVILVFRKPLGLRPFAREISISLRNRHPPVPRLMKIIGRSVYEEVLWRGTVQEILGKGIVSWFISALLFTIPHHYFYTLKGKHMSFPILSELFLFALLLSALYHRTGRIMIPVAMHFVRNFLIECKSAYPPDQMIPLHQDDSIV